MRVVSVVGARPQFIKLSAIARDFAEHEIEHVIVHTGQHYDPRLSDVFFEDFGIPAPDEHLGVGSGGHGEQTGAMLSKMDDVLLRHEPDWVLVYGDTNSTLAATVSAVKLHLPVAHLEAGLRSFNRRMPEEHNRVLTDHAADLCLAPSSVAMEQLAAEGLAHRSELVGDVMVDVLHHLRETRLGSMPAVTEGFVATIHRADNTDDPIRLKEIIGALASLPHEVVLFAHPRLVAKAADAGIELNVGSIRLEPPAGYPELMGAVLHARGVITDSGGLQKEAFVLGVPCTTVRPETEWIETVDLGWNVLATSPAEITAGALRPQPSPTVATPYGAGDASRRVREVLVSRLNR